MPEKFEINILQFFVRKLFKKFKFKKLQFISYSEDVCDKFELFMQAMKLLIYFNCSTEQMSLEKIQVLYASYSSYEKNK